jgi:hypothetical protein
MSSGAGIVKLGGATYSFVLQCQEKRKKVKGENLYGKKKTRRKCGIRDTKN